MDRAKSNSEESMIATKSLQEAVYCYLFPGGAIPFACKGNIPAIDARIKELEQLAEGTVIEGMNRRLDAKASKDLTEQIVQLRDSCNPAMSYWEIMRRLGNVITPDAARNRYNDAKKAAQEAALQKIGQVQACPAPAAENPPASESAVPAEDGKDKEIKQVISPAVPPALLEAKPELCEEATIRESQIVQESEKVPTRHDPKIPHSEDDLIFDMRESGKKYKEIVEALAEKGIVCTIGDVAPRYQAICRRKATQPKTAPDPSLPGVEGAQDAARANPRGTPEEEQSTPASPKPDPKLDYDEVVDAKIITMKKRGMLNYEIAQALERNPGGSWTTQKVDARYTELKRQGLV